MDNQEQIKEIIKKIINSKITIVLFTIILVIVLIKLPTEYFTKIIGILITLFGIVWAIFVTHKYAPNARLNLSYKTSPCGFVILIMEVENSVIRDVRSERAQTQLSCIYVLIQVYIPADGGFDCVHDDPCFQKVDCSDKVCFIHPSAV